MKHWFYSHKKSTIWRRKSLSTRFLLNGMSILITKNTMKTSWNRHIFRVTGHLCREFTTQRPVTRSFDVFFDLRPNKRLSKQSCGWWFETPSRPLWRHDNASKLWLPAIWSNAESVFMSWGHINALERKMTPIWSTTPRAFLKQRSNERFW